VPIAALLVATVTVSVWPTVTSAIDIREQVDGRVILDKLIGGRARDR
jgi:hypothetical protein